MVLELLAALACIAQSISLQWLAATCLHVMCLQLTCANTASS